jgi:ribonuclease Z
VKVIFLGTAAARPTLSRWLSCVVVQRKGEFFMFDCGEGTQYRLLQEKIRIWNRPAHVFISHLHYDHWGGLFGLIASLSLEGRQHSLHIYGPPGIRALFMGLAKRVQKKNFPLNVWECHPGLLLETSEYCVLAREATHSIPTLAFALIENTRPGKFYPNRAKALGIPQGPLWGKIQIGESVQVNSRTITPDQVIGPPRPGRKIVYAVDTRPNKHIEELSTNADLLIHDGTFSSLQQDRAEETGHSTAYEAATLAKNANVQQLVLTHISARFRTDEILVNEAKTAFEQSRVAYDGLTLLLPPHG